jgi:hypothetical protein
VLYGLVAVVLFLAGILAVAARPSSAVGWVVVVVQLVAGVSLAAHAPAAVLAGVTVAPDGIAWVGRRGLVRFQAAWEDIAGFSVTNGPRVLPCVELADGGPLPLVVYGMTPARSRSLVDELEQERRRRR